MKYRSLTSRLLAGASFAAAVGSGALAASFDIPHGDLASALDAYSAQSGVAVVVSAGAAKNVQTQGLKGDYSAPDALSRILKGTGFVANPSPSGVVEIIGAANKSSRIDIAPIQLAQAAPPPRATVETVTVTSSKLGGADVQSIPIAITAMSQEQLTATQTAGGPDLIKNVPNMTFTKTNFTGYSIQIRGIGTQAISVSTDPAVAVALNDIPFIRNHFFEQEFYDLSQAEVLRGPQGTLYGRNATAGVVNLVSAKPSDQFEAMASGDIGNYKNRRFEGMINLPIVDDWLDIRLAGEWTKRTGYTTNALTGNQVDGRDLWSSRLSVRWRPLSSVDANIVWEHYSEDDDRMRTAKQLCKTDNPTNHSGLLSMLGQPVPSASTIGNGIGLAFSISSANFSQGCLPASMYAPESYQVPYGYALPYVTAGYVSGAMNANIDPYASTTQSPNLRVIETQIDPRYQAKNDTVEMNVDYHATPALTFTSQTGFNNDFLWSTEDYNRFNTSPGIFRPTSGNIRVASLISPYPDCGTDFTSTTAPVDGTYYFGDPQLGCSNRLVAQDISREHAWQLSQEFRVASTFSGPFNFSVGGNYMHYETEEDYFVFANSLTLFAATSGSGFANYGPWVPGVSDDHECMDTGPLGSGPGYQYNNPLTGAGQPTSTCYYIDPNGLGSVNSEGHNYFLSQNPYTLNSYAGFGEAYYNLFSDLKLTGGVRWTEDRKHFTDIPSELLALGIGYLSTGTVDQQWDKFTGRFAANWTPKLDFTDQTLIYGSYARGYKAGGANPPGAVLYSYGNGTQGVPVHPLTFDPEYINAFELGSKNTLLDGALTLNGDIFFYDYKGYQISEIVDRTAINLNFDATVRGAELEATYEPLPGFKLHFAGGYEKTRINNGESAVDLMDRTAGHPGWVLMRPFVTQSSNCVFPDYVALALLMHVGGEGNPATSACGSAYQGGAGQDVRVGLDPGIDAGVVYNWNNGNPYYSDPIQGTVLGTYPVTINRAGYPAFTYPGFDPRAGNPNFPNDPYVGQNTYNGVDYGPAPNNGAGFSKELGGNELPNAPPFTVSASAEYTTPLTPEWAGTIHVDYYWQDYFWARVFNDNPYDRVRGYTNVNLALILTSQDGWQVMGYLKNIFNTTAITGTFLNSDDSGLTTNVFLTDPRLFGVRVTKNW